MINLVDHKSYPFSTGIQWPGRSGHYIYHQTGPRRDHLLPKMNSMPVPEARDVRDDARDLEDEYESSAGLKVHKRMTYYVTKEIPQRGAMTTTCTGPLCGEKAGDVRPHGGEHPVEGLHHRHPPGQGDGQTGGSQHGLTRALPRLQGVFQAPKLQDPKEEVG